jgi:hypothetical protein
MDSSLNNFEREILQQVADAYPFLHSHIPLLRVNSRELTGVGMYVNFTYRDNSDYFSPIPSNYNALSGKSHLNMEGLEHGLAYEISTSNGRVEFIELVTYGEPWDGAIRKFWFNVNT